MMLFDFFMPVLLLFKIVYLCRTAHKGMLEAARFVLAEEGPLLGYSSCSTVGLMKLWVQQDYKLYLTGHPYRGGVVPHGDAHQRRRSKIQPARIECCGFGSAACVDERLATDPQYHGFINTFVLQVCLSTWPWCFIVCLYSHDCSVVEVILRVEVKEKRSAWLPPMVKVSLDLCNSCLIETQ